MAITSSAKKAIRSSERKRVFNSRRKAALYKATKTVRQAVIAKDGTKAGQSLAAAYQAIDKALKRGVIKKNTAARKKSRLALAAAKAKA
jgi:small subunit ribosomal protein S20